MTKAGEQPTITQADIQVGWDRPRTAYTSPARTDLELEPNDR